ncbi:MAG TPA: hypothetical protein VG838_15360 [Opitutaceae bacterium]|nr:hypothetical protein [Opitutaceae bacterium]
MFPRVLLCLGLLAAAGLRAAEPAPEPALLGKVVNGSYLSPTGVFKVVVPVLPELGGSVTDTENVVTFEDDFSVHISIAAFPQDATQRWELSTRGPKDYLIYFFTTFVLPDFARRYAGTSVESARFLPTLNDGTLLTYTLLPGGSMFADRVALPGTDPKSIVAKRGNLVFVKSGHIFVISSEFAEHALEHGAVKRTTAEEDEKLRERLLNLLGKMEFTQPVTPDAKK